MAKVPLRAIRRRSVDFESLWLITFADLMVQLMAFFAVAYSFSIQGQGKTEALIKALKEELGTAKSAGGLLPGGHGLDPKRATDLEKLVSDLKGTNGPDVGTRLRIVSFRGSILFDENSAVVKPDFETLVKRIAELVDEYPGFSLVCEGHAAPGERGTSSDPWGLSGLRAQAVARVLVMKGVDPKILAAEARGDALVEGDPSSPEGRALQRRVKFRFQRVAER